LIDINFIITISKTDVWIIKETEIRRYCKILFYNIPKLEKIDFENVVLSKRIWVITILSSMGVFMDGYALSIFSSAYIYLKYSFLSVSIITSIAASSIYIGMFVGSIVLGRLSDLLGRKRIYVYDLLITAIFLILTGISHNFIEFVAFQILAGLGIGADYPISSSIQAEFSPKKTRGKLLVFNIFSWTFGSIAFYLISIPIVMFFGDVSWRIMYITGAVIPLIVIISRRNIPESPYWLMLNRSEEEAETVVNEVKSVNTKEIVSPPSVQRGEPEMRGKNGVYRLILFTSVAWFCYDVASYGVWNYTPSLFIQEGSSYVATILSTLLEEIPVFAGTIVCLLAIDKVGRKKLESAGFLLAGISLIVFGVISFHSVLPFFMIFSAFALMHFFHNTGPTNITYLYPAEIFPTRIRGTAMGVSTAASRLGAILGVFAFPILISGLNNLWSSFLCYLRDNWLWFYSGSGSRNQR
jgi:putative MFS transporter